MNKKGFTLVELIAVIVIIGILSRAGYIAITRAITNSHKKAYANFESQMVSATKNYLSTHTEEANFTPDSEGGISGTKVFRVSELQAGGYLDVLVDPLSKKSCSATLSGVIVNASMAPGGFNVSYEMIPCLYCVDKNYQTYKTFETYLKSSKNLTYTSCSSNSSCKVLCKNNLSW